MFEDKVFEGCHTRRGGGLDESETRWDSGALAENKGLPLVTNRSCASIKPTLAATRFFLKAGLVFLLEHVRQAAAQIGVAGSGYELIASRPRRQGNCRPSRLENTRAEGCKFKWSSNLPPGLARPAFDYRPMIMLQASGWPSGASFMGG